MTSHTDTDDLPITISNITNLQGTYIQVLETCHFECDNNNYY